MLRFPGLARAAPLSAAAFVALAFGPLAIAQTSTPAARLENCARIMPLGDSITLGGNGGYRNDLYTGLEQNNCGVSYVGTLFDQYTKVADKRHEGHSGFTIGDIARNVNDWLASTQPNIVLLMAGTNDIASWTGESAEQIGARHDALIEQIRTARPGVWIFVASIPPQTSMLIPPNGIDRAVLTSSFNITIRRNVDARAAAGQRVRFVDVNAALTLADLFDGIHPKEAAYAVIAQRFLEAIRAALNESSAPATAPATASSPASPPQAAPPAQSRGGGEISSMLVLELVCLLAWIRRRPRP
jgi:lysophospholipase L1-like esterase